MRFLFVTGIDGFCHRYEVLHRAEQLLRRGIGSTIRHFTDARLLGDLARADCLFVYRTPETPLVRELLRRARRARRVVFGSIDDLIFVPDEDALPDLSGVSRAERDRWLDGVQRYRRTLEGCDVFLAPTEPLASAARALGLETYIHRDALSAAELGLADATRAMQSLSGDRDASHAERPVVLGYFSGTPSHDRDFALAFPAVATLLDRHPQLLLRIFGPLNLTTSGAIAARIERAPLLPWPALPAAIAGVDVNLAPVRWQRRFEAAKGEVKYLEAGAVGVPTVASPTPAFRHAIRDGAHGRLAAEPQDWEPALEELIVDSTRRRALGEAAQRDVHLRYSPEARADEWIVILNQVLRGVGTSSSRAFPARESGQDVDAAASGPRVAIEPDAYLDLCWQPTEQVTPPLRPAEPLRQVFRSGRAGLFRVDVCTVTYGQRLDHPLHFRLVRDDGVHVAEHATCTSMAPDRSWYAIEFPADPDSHARRYLLEIEAQGTGPGNAVSLGLGARSPAGADETTPAARNGAQLEAPLALRTFAAWAFAGTTPLVRPEDERSSAVSSGSGGPPRRSPSPSPRRDD